MQILQLKQIHQMFNESFSIAIKFFQIVVSIQVTKLFDCPTEANNDFLIEFVAPNQFTMSALDERGAVIAGSAVTQVTGTVAYGFEINMDTSTGAFNNYNCTFNPIEKIVELYERLVQAEKDKVEYLEKLMKGK